MTGLNRAVARAVVRRAQAREQRSIGGIGMNGGLNHDRVVLDSIESAHRFVSALAEALVETKRDIQNDLERGPESNTRYTDALQLVLHKLEHLEDHVKRGRRSLNDLRSLRRLLFEERSASTSGVPPKPTPINNDETLVLPFRWSRQRAFSSTRIPQRGNGEAMAMNVPWYVRTTPAFFAATNAEVPGQKESPR